MADDLTPIEANSQGLGVEACPHRPGTPEANAWAREWTVFRQACGPFGATDADKIAAGLPALPTIVGDGPAVPNVQVVDEIIRLIDATPGLVDGLTGFIRDTVFPVIEQIHASLVGAGLAEPVDPKARALARKRRPYVCHRHGPTAGGFCRRCRHQ